MSTRRHIVTSVGVSLALAGAAAAAAPLAGAAPPAPTVVGPVVHNDASYDARRGLMAQEGPSPRLVAVPALRGWTADGRFATDGPGRIILFGRHLWLYRGPDPLHLSAVGWGVGFSREVGQVMVTPDGGFLIVGSTADELGGATPDGVARWHFPSSGLPGAEPVPQAPVAVTGTGTVYALGGRAAVLNGETGAVIAPIVDPPGDATSPVAAPDGSLRVLDVSGEPTLLAYGLDGRRLWARPLGAAGASPLSVAADGTTYVGIWTGNGRVSDTTGQVLAVRADGEERWRAPVGAPPSRPAIDSRGGVWALTMDGRLTGLDPDGAPRFRRVVATPSSIIAPDPVRAIGTDILVTRGATSIRVGTRPRRSAPVTPRLAASPARMRFLTTAAACTAPPGGRPRSCLYRLTSGGAFIVRAPVDGDLRLEIRSTAGRPVARLGAFKVLAGETRVRFHGSDGTVCACYLRPGGYRVRALVPLAGGRTRWLSAPFTVGPSHGRILLP